jgi:3-oxoacyl-[acyl-carrier protein] reductase
MAGELDGRVALVTGAGRGIGREVALGLAAAGARVALLARSRYELESVAADIRGGGGTARVVTADVSDPGPARAACQQAAAELGDVAILINNAATVSPLGPTSRLDPASVAAAFALNVTAVIDLSAVVIPAMTAAGWGRIINVSSGIVANPGMMVGGTVYAASKAALEAHTLNLAVELEGSGVTVNAYRPGAVDTAMQRWIRDQSPEAIGTVLHERFVTSHANGSLLSPEQSAAALLARLPGDASGQIWSVDEATTPAES